MVILWFPWWCGSCLHSLRNIHTNAEFSRKGGWSPGGWDCCLNGPSKITWIIVARLKNLLTLIKQPSAESNSWLSHKLIHKPICKFVSSCLQFLNCLCRWFREPVALLDIIHNAWARSYRLVIKIPIFLLSSFKVHIFFYYSHLLSKWTHTQTHMHIHTHTHVRLFLGQIKYSFIFYFRKLLQFCGCACPFHTVILPIFC